MKKQIVEVVPRVFLADLDTSQQEDGFRSRKITHVLTVMDEISTMKERLFKSFTHRNVGVKENEPHCFLTHLGNCFSFMNEGSAPNCGVVVVSWLGISRNVAVVIAFVMKNFGLTFEEASVKVNQTGYSYSINESLITQLKLFERMKCVVDTESKTYTTWHNKSVADYSAFLDKVASSAAVEISNSKHAQHLSSILMQRAGGSLDASSFAPDPEAGSNGKSTETFACSFCKRKLFSAQNVIIHNKSKDPFDVEDWECAYLFFEPMSWMKNDLSQNTGKFACPSCGILVGDWDWDGTLCSCHTKVKPTFRIHKAKLVRASSSGQLLQRGETGWKRTASVWHAESSKKSMPRNKPLAQLFGRKKKDDEDELNRPAPRISSASELESKRKTEIAATPPTKPASDELLSSTAKVPLDPHERKLKRKARRAHAKAIARQHRQQEKEKRIKEALARGVKPEEEDDEDEDDEEDDDEEEEDDDDDDDDDEEESVTADTAPTESIETGDHPAVVSLDNAESGDTPKHKDFTQSAPDLVGTLESSGSSEKRKSSKHNKHRHHHRHHHHRHSHKSRSASRKGGEEPKPPTSIMGKMLATFKKKDKVALKLAYDGEREEEPETPSKQHPAIYLTCADDLPKDMRKMLKVSKITDMEAKQNFVILLHCLHFLTKRAFVYTPKNGEPIKVGRRKRKEKAQPWENIPSAETLIAETNAKKDLKVQEVVGEGGFGRVFMAKNAKGKGRVAVKKMKHINPRDQFRNLSEVYFLKRVDHPNIVKYISSYIVQDELWLVTEFMEGGTLSQAIKSFDFQEKQIAFVAKEMLQGIQYLHQNQLTHRDLKSANIMMTTQGDIKLIDFGLCMDMSRLGDKKVHMVGSPFWMPPEMIKREQYSFPVDIWSFAVCLLELANGQPPNRKSALKAMFTAGTEGYPRPFKNPAQWTRDFKDFMGRCLTIDPQGRATAAELLQHPFLAKADTRKGMKKILSHIFLQNTMEMMNLGGI